MSKNGGMGSKRIGSMTSKGMGKCDAGSRAEQCGNGSGLKKGRNEYIGKEKHQNFFTPETPVLNSPNHITLLQNQLSALELDLNKIREKLINLKID